LWKPHWSERTNKQALIEFVLEAEGELAESLETYAIAQSRRERHDSVQQDLIIDSFLTEAKVGDKTPLDLFWKANQSFQTAIASQSAGNAVLLAYLP